MLDAMKRGEMRRGRDVNQLDIGYPGSSIAVEAPIRDGVLLAGDRAPDAHIRGAAGQQRRLFELFNGPHWTLLALDDGSVVSRPGLQVHSLGEDSELVDDIRQVQAAYDIDPGDRVPVRPDGYVGAILSAGESAALEDT